MTASANWHAHNLVGVHASKLPLGNSFFAKQAPLEEHMDRHGHFEVAELYVHTSVADAVCGDIFDEHGQGHTLDSTGRTMRQASEARSVSLIQRNDPVNSTNGWSLSHGGAK